MTSQSNRFRTFFAAGVLASSAVLSAGAQSAALGNIAGIIRDSSGALVPGANVVITNLQTGASRTVTSDAEGHYSATYLQPGHYSVVLGGGSFGTVNQKDIVVTVGSTSTLDVALPASTVTTDVSVTADVPLIDSEKVETSQTVSQVLVANLPVNGRRWDNFVLLTPNVTPDGNTGLISYRGISGLYNTNLVDGANNQQAFFSEARGRSIGAPYVYPLDSIQEFQSSVTGYSAELGQAAGGVINAITKSGSNAFHGDLFEYYRTPGYNALDPLSKYSGRITNNPFLLGQPVKVQHQYGASVGGPIIKDKLFFHATYDGYRRVNPITYLSSYNGTTTSIAGLVHLCDGGTTYVTDAGVTYPTTIAGISSANCTQVINFVQTKLLGSFARNTTQDIYFPRLDYQLNSKTHLSASYLFEDFKQPNGYNGATTVTNGSVTQNGTSSFHERFLVANAETALTPTTSNVVHFQFSRDLETATTNTGGPAINVTNLFSYGETSALPRGKFPDEHRFQITDIFSKVIGKHSFKAGVDVNLIHEQIANLFGGDGSFSYSSGGPELNFANYIQDVFQVNGGRHYTSFSQTTDPITGVGADDFWNKDLDVFLEDEWKITPKLLLSIGGRYDVQLVPQPDRPNTTSQPAYDATSVINIYYGAGQPRFGFAWTPQEGTVVRGGYGIFYGLTSNSTYYTERRENGVYQQQFSLNAATAPSTTYVTAGATCTPVAPATVCFQQSGAYQAYAPQGGIPAFTPPGPSPINQVTLAATPAVNPGLPALTLNVRGANYEFQNPFTHSVDLAVEQVLPLRATLTVAYAGTRGMRLPIFVDTNVDPTSAIQAPFNFIHNGVTTQFTEPVYTRRISNNTGSVLTGFSDVNSWYHSLVFSVRKPMAHGVEVLANYTWAHTMDDGQASGTNGTFNGTDAPLIPFALGHRQGRGAEYAKSDLDQRGRFVGSIVALSSLPIDNRYARYAVNGWQLSGTLTAQTGTPVTAFFSNTITLTPNSAKTPSLLPSTINGDGGITGAVVTSGTGTRVPDQVASRNAFKGPGVHNVDARISREFPFLREGMHFELAAEAFNVLNHRNYLGVANSGYTYQGPGTSGCPAATTVAGCIVPFTGTGTAAFGAGSSTSGTLYTPRQLQLLGKLYF
jgi:hypothetical protein